MNQIKHEKGSKTGSKEISGDNFQQQGTGADTIFSAFLDYQSRFIAITSRAARRFAMAEWQGMREDTVERLDLYTLVVDQYLHKLSKKRHPLKDDTQYWAKAKEAFTKRIIARKDRELAATFFNSMVRKRLNTIGADPITTFVYTDETDTTAPIDHATLITFPPETDTQQRVMRILSAYPFTIPLSKPSETTIQAAHRIDTTMDRISVDPHECSIEMLSQPFYRGMGAYLVGRVISKEAIIPLVFAFINRNQTLVLDAVLTDEETVTILFSFTRSYFHVATNYPAVLVAFIRTLLPNKRVAEIYTTLGYHKHGKTELYRELTHHFTVCCQDQFDYSLGKRGMVMIVFNMPKDDLVFKVIREKIAPPKQTNRSEVMAKYDLVFHHDRAGRLIDAQNFDHLSFNKCCFTAPLLKEMQEDAADTVQLTRDEVVIEQLYVERRVTPLDIYIRKDDADAVASVVIDYGQAVKDLAVSNIFPGDMLLKNFGVTSRGRVVFYDYDELMLVTECVFRNIPRSHNDEDEMRATPWYFVGKNDVFPEELAHFLGLPDPLRRLFMRHHGDLFTAGYWQDIQTRLQADEPMHIFPYGAKHRLRSTIANI